MVLICRNENALEFILSNLTHHKLVEPMEHIFVSLGIGIVNMLRDSVVFG